MSDSPSTNKQFRVLGHLPDWCPRYIPWSFVAPYEAQALKNHSQSLERLHERGGLSPEELYAVVNGVDLRDMDWDKVNLGTAAEWLLGRLRVLEDGQ